MLLNKLLIFPLPHVHLSDMGVLVCFSY